MTFPGIIRRRDAFSLVFAAQFSARSRRRVRSGTGSAATYVAEDGATIYTTEDGTAAYVPPS